ncbi:large-conductance mechanosensitive channel protein MscL [Caulobacter sp. SLTY]|uniref:large-conductance mechanosensitive channel protein MscL n=1 Tax=Caulobacter sp. SLTY TaxID=2683262 RepID=UPI0014123627|nr:large-conductance mechanosensitive channel protein MscL [Caulobacter sp. SLTY]NBB14146.1 large-conductance mechanosensitive channel protein MscL [Caulobacter sp. SLTY]
MSVVSEFRQFISRGNVIDLAVGVIIGAAFGKIVTVLVDGIIMPPIGLILGKVDFSDLKLVLAPKVGDTAEVAIAYGAFINTIIQFMIVAFAVFLLVKLVNAARRKEAEAPAPSAPPAPTPSEALLTEIRDLLAAQKAAAPAPKVVPVKAEAAPAKAVVRKPAAKKPPATKKT